MDERSQRIADRFEIPMLVVAFLVIPVLILQESDVGEPWITVADVGNWLVWLGFAFEAVVMLWVIPSRWRWIRDNPLALPIVILTPPFAPPALQAARVFRLLRLLRLFRAFSLIRTFFSPEGFKWAAFVTAFIVIGGGAAFGAIEGGTSLDLWDGLWWSVTTVTTVSYGDIQPGTDAGRIIAVVVILAGVAFVAMLTAAMAQQFLANSIEDDQKREKRLVSELSEIRAQLNRIERAQATPGVPDG